MKDLAALLRAKYEKSATAKRAQVRNEILVRGGVKSRQNSPKAGQPPPIWKVLTKNKEITCSYKTFVCPRPPLAASSGNDPNQGDHARKTKRIHLGSNTKPGRIDG